MPLVGGFITELTRRSSKKDFQNKLDKTQLFLDTLNNIKANYNTIIENIKNASVEIISVNEAKIFIDGIKAKEDEFLKIDYHKANSHLMEIYRNYLKESVKTVS